MLAQNRAEMLAGGADALGSARLAGEDLAHPLAQILRQ